MLAAPASSVTSYAFVVWSAALLGRTQGVGLTEAGTIVGLSNALGGVTGTLIAGVMIDALFITGDYGVIACLAEADVNQTGGPNPGTGDITISDISSLIDYLFITGSSLGLAECL